MVTRANVRLGLTGAILLMIFGSFSACTDSPMGPEVPAAAQQAKADSEECIFINGILHCAPTRAP